MHTTDMNPDTASIGVSAPKRILQSVLTALNEGRIAEAAAQFDDHFTFTDYALDLEFTDKGAWSNSFKKPGSSSRTPWWKWILPSNAEITPLLNRSLPGQQCRMDPHAFEFQF